MQFNSVDFLIFFPVVVFVYYLVPKKCRAIWLLISSYYFYMSWNAKYALLIGTSTVVTYACAILVEKYGKSKKKRPKKKLAVVLCISLNLGILFIFKYANFTIASVNRLLNVLHINAIDRRFDLLLPVGISFYTFQALGYFFDVYRGDIKAEKNIIRYALFVSFFPQLVAGPIERSKNLLTQIQGIEQRRLWDAERIRAGVILMVWGLFMKMVIADRVSLLVDTVFNDYRMYGATELIAGAIGFSIQIYCDFGSYSMIAIGAAKVLGFTLMENFNTPYFAKNIRDFWSRWHISLSTWFRDYLYIPLGGNRKGEARKLLNIMIVFLASGLWHGASWAFVAWGAIHGLYQVFGDIRRRIGPRLKEKAPYLTVKTNCLSWKLLQVVTTYALVTFSWIFFRADSLTHACIYISRIFTKPTPWVLFNGGLYSLGLDRTEANILFTSLIVLFLVDLIRYFKGLTLDAFLAEQNMWFSWFVTIALIVSIFIYGKYGPLFDAKQFIYFQF